MHKIMKPSLNTTDAKISLDNKKLTKEPDSKSYKYEYEVVEVQESKILSVYN